MAICKAKFVAVHFNSEPLSQTAPVHDVMTFHLLTFTTARLSASPGYFCGKRERTPYLFIVPTARALL